MATAAPTRSSRDLAGVNVKRVHRLWRHERLSVPCRRPRTRRADRKVVRPVEATRPNQVWTYDFVHDACANGQRLKILTVTDEFTRESLAIAVATTLRARGVLLVLERLVAQHGAPAYLRSDTGPEFVAQAEPTLAPGAARADRLHCARKSLAERLRGKLQRTFARRVFEYGVVPQRPSGAGGHWAMVAAV